MKFDLSVEKKIAGLIKPLLQTLGFGLVRVRFTGSQDKTIQIMAERNNEEIMTVDDCALISGEVSKILEVDNILSDAYNLEISSPGIDRPLVDITDFDRYAGFNAKIEMKILIGGRKRFKGNLLGVEEKNVKISLEDGIIKLPYKDIMNAKLLLAEDLFKVAKKGAEG